MSFLWESTRVLHWGPLLALFVITEITLSGLYCLLQWWPISSTGGLVHLMIYLNWDVLILYNFFNAMYVGPGYVKKKWMPNKTGDTKYLQFCGTCEGFKAPRSHHCRKCQRCVMKMDHHCPWINNCVGHRNHASFTQFTFFAPLGCIHALCVLIPSLYRAINRNYYLLHGVIGVPIVNLTPSTFFASLLGLSLSFGVTVAVAILCIIQYWRQLLVGYKTDLDKSEDNQVSDNRTSSCKLCDSSIVPIVEVGYTSLMACAFAIGLALAVITAVGQLFRYQLKNILKNETGIESWIKDKAEYRERKAEEKEFVFPYDIGRWKNFNMVFYFTDRPELDGTWWPVKEGCDQYTLTIEQLKQKQEKKDRSVVYLINEGYSGALFPITKGLKVCCCPPCTDEPRIPLTQGDKVLVSRWKKRWLYGDKLLDEFERKAEVKRIRGWFPRRCAVQVMEELSENGHCEGSGDQDSTEEQKKDQ